MAEQENNAGHFWGTGPRDAAGTVFGVDVASERDQSVFVAREFQGDRFLIGPDHQTVEMSQPTIGNSVVWLSPHGLMVDGKRISEPLEPAELRPPPEHAGKPLHWVRQGAMKETIAFWWRNADSGSWETFFGDVGDGQFMAGLGYRYLGPAEWGPLDHLAGNLYAARRGLELERDEARTEAAELGAKLARLSGAELSGNDIRSMAACLYGAFHGFPFARAVEALKAADDLTRQRWHETAYHAYLHCGYAGPAARERVEAGGKSRAGGDESSAPSPSHAQDAEQYTHVSHLTELRQILRAGWATKEQIARNIIGLCELVGAGWVDHGDAWRAPYFLNTDAAQNATVAVSKTAGEGSNPSIGAIPMIEGGKSSPDAGGSFASLQRGPGGIGLAAMATPPPSDAKATSVPPKKPFPAQALKTGRFDDPRRVGG